MSWELIQYINCRGSPPPTVHKCETTFDRLPLRGIPMYTLRIHVIHTHVLQPLAPTCGFKYIVQYSTACLTVWLCRICLRHKTWFYLQTCTNIFIEKCTGEQRPNPKKHITIAGHRHRGPCRRHRYSGIQHLSPVLLHSSNGLGYAYSDTGQSGI